MDFEAYLVSKKIDSNLFRSQESLLWNAWKTEFEQLHPNSFTAQKLYLINPVRRKYPLKIEKAVPSAVVTENNPEVRQPAETPPPAVKPAVPRPVFKPKPKTS